MRREPAWRVFAGEFNDAVYEIKGSGEKTPSYIVSPLGAKINRVYLTGVLTDVETISEGGDLLRAHVSDPTGVFTLYSGQYQPEVTDQLSQIETPVFISVVGKSRTYEPEEGALFVSLRPENVQEVSIEARDRWIIEACWSTLERINATAEALKMNQPNHTQLRKLGYNNNLSQGLVHAIENYEDINISKYKGMVLEALNYIQPSQQSFTEKKQVKEKKTDTSDEKPSGTKEKKTDETAEFEEVENMVLEAIKELEGDEGAPWDEIVQQCEKKKLTSEAIEEALSSLMDKGFIYEPVLGTIKTT